MFSIKAKRLTGKKDNDDSEQCTHGGKKKNAEADICQGQVWTCQNSGYFSANDWY